MASQSLYRKWRSQTFGDLVGQEPVIRTLKNALNSGNLAHAYLFAGPRGTGKTSTARLLAKTINCPNAKNGEPCNVCEQCREITAGNSFNVIEIDAASNRGIDSIRELREKVMVPPSTGKYKIYILDEAHMLTTEAFNALLKTLEEPPPHAIFVMATTDVHKMLPTVLSRCQRFDFKRITTRQIVEHLHFIAEQEQVTLDHGAAELIARAAAGGMRDALSLLDQTIAYCGHEIALTQVQTMLGVADPRAIQKFIIHIADLDSAAGLHLIHELAEAGGDLRQINAQVAEYWRSMMLARAGADIAAILDTTTDELREITQVAQRFALEELTECARIFAQNELMQKGQGTPQLGLELAFLNCVGVHRRASTSPTASASSPRLAPTQERAYTVPPAVPTPVETRPPIETKAVFPTSVDMRIPSPEKSRSELEARITPPEISVVSLQESEPATPVTLASSEQPAEVSAALPDWDSLSYPDEENEPPVSLFEPRTPQAELQPASLTGSIEATVSVTSSLTIEDVKEKWEYVKIRVKSKKDGAKIAALLNGYAIEHIEISSKLPVIILRAGAVFHYTSLQKSEHIEAIEWAMKIELKQECRVRLLPPGSNGLGGGAVIPPFAGRSAGSPGAVSSNAHDTSNHSSNTLQAPPARSPHRERPALASPSSESESLDKRSSLQGSQVKLATSPVTTTSSAEPLARNTVVRENIRNTASPQSETRQQIIEQKAKSDPVVNEIIRLFRAEIKDIRPK